MNSSWLEAHHKAKRSLILWHLCGNHAIVTTSLMAVHTSYLKPGNWLAENWNLNQFFTQVDKVPHNRLLLKLYTRTSLQLDKGLANKQISKSHHWRYILIFATCIVWCTPRYGSWPVHVPYLYKWYYYWYYISHTLVCWWPYNIPAHNFSEWSYHHIEWPWHSSNLGTTLANAT